MLFSLSMLDYYMLAIAYMLGSIPFGMLVARFARIGDLRGQGSGNIGATNMLRVGGIKLGAATLLLDAFKGSFAVCMVQYGVNNFGLNEFLPPIAGVFAVLGHVFPLWLGFKGGKGVATTIAVLWCIYWPLGAVTTIVWLAVFYFTRISSLAAILAMLSVPTVALYSVEELGHVIVYICFGLSMLVIVKHRENINRLIHGEEGKVM